MVLDVVEQCGRDPDYRVTTDDFARWEQDHGQISSDSIVLIRTGFSSRWPDAARYLGTADRGPEAVARLHFPGLHPNAARWLVASRPVTAVGIDTPSIDYGQSTLFESHRALYEREHPRVREPERARPPAAARRLSRRAADEDREGERRAAAGGRHRSTLEVRRSGFITVGGQTLLDH